MDTKTLEEIIAAFDAYKAKKEGEPTIFSVLGRTYDEDLISRLILKCLMDDPEAIAALLAKCDEHLERRGIEKRGITVTEGKCEQVTEGLSRVDIYIRGSNALGERFALLIENKIGTWEHDNQTQTYADWANRDHKGDTIYCVFLRPSWNKSPISEERFVPVNYKMLADMFTVENRFINEFKLHVTQHLEVNETMDPIVMNNSKELFDIVKELGRKRNELAKEINEAIKDKEFLGVAFKEDHSPSYGVWRYCAKDLHWWDDKYKYYFYIEFKIGEDGDLNNVCVQRTLKTYSRNADKLVSFITEMKARYESTRAGNCYWIHPWPIKPKGDLFSTEWNLSVKEQILKEMKVAFEEQKEIVEEFLTSEYYRSGNK